MVGRPPLLPKSKYTAKSSGNFVIGIDKKIVPPYFMSEKLENNSTILIPISGMIQQLQREACLENSGTAIMELFCENS